MILRNVFICLFKQLHFAFLKILLVKDEERCLFANDWNSKGRFSEKLLPIGLQITGTGTPQKIIILTLEHNPLPQTIHIYV